MSSSDSDSDVAHDSAGYFRTSTNAIKATVALLLLVLAVYVTVHSFRTLPVEPWKGAVQVSSDALCQLTYIDEKLVKFFSDEDIRAFQERIESKAGGFRSRSLADRRAILRGFYNEVLSRAFGSASPLEALFGPDADVSEPDLLLGSLDLEKLAAWVRIHLHEISTEGNKRSLAASYLQNIATLQKSESDRRTVLENEIAALEPPLDFNWLWHDGSGWIFEIAMWSLIGLLSNTLITLISVTKAGEYAAEHFALLFPKLVLAPILSLIVVSLWQSGFSESSVMFLNLPYFLVLAFALGFGTEALYKKIRDLVSAIIGETAAFRGTQRSRGGRLLRLAVERKYADLSPGDLAPAVSIAEFGENLRKVGHPIVERALVEREGEQ